MTTVLSFPSPISSAVSEVKQYTDEYRTVLACVNRHEDQRRSLTNEDGKSLLSREANLLPLFNLLAIKLEHRKEDGTVYLCSDEWDADSIGMLCSVTASTWPPISKDGATRQPWRRQFTEELRGLNVVLLPKATDESRALMRSIARILHLNAKSVKLIELDENPRAYIVKSTEQFVARVAETPVFIPDEKLPLFDFTDVGNGKRLAYHMKGRLMFCEQWKPDAYLAFDGRVWRQSETDTQARAKDVVRLIQLETDSYSNPDDHDQVRTHYEKSQQASAIKNMIKMARDEVEQVVPNDLDNKPDLFNVQNGTIDLTTGTLREFMGSDCLTKLSPFVFNPEAQCPRWNQFLSEIFSGDEELIAYMQRAVGYCVTGHANERVFFMLYGDGANGKSTFVEVLSEVFGPDYSAGLPTASLYGKIGDDGPGDELARLRGSRLVYASEGNEGKKFDTGKLKRITGNEKISCRFLYGKVFEFQPTFKVFFSTNHKPVITETVDAVWDRVKLIPFLSRFSEDKRDPQLKQKLLAEAPGILRWIIDGAKTWYTEGLGESSAVEVATKEYRHDSDLIGQFITERCEFGPEYQTQSSTLFGEYTRWMLEMGHGQPLSSVKFAKALIEKGHRKETSGVVRWFGIRPIATFPT